MPGLLDPVRVAGLVASKKTGQQGITAKPNDVGGKLLSLFRHPRLQRLTSIALVHWQSMVAPSVVTRSIFLRIDGFKCSIFLF